ncbi:MAG TPA: DUF2490 domain-containing protein [Burkholderiales bacterium]|nr:DUF2490 domain-containing protein [Burkholderiales bacterium]
MIPESRRARAAAFVCLALALATGRANAAEDRFWPEFDGFYQVDPRTRVFLLGSATRAEEPDDREGKARFEDGTLGVHLDVALEPVWRTNRANADWVKDRYLWMRVGYNYVGNYHANGDRYHEDRGVLELSTREPVALGLALTGRLRWDARDIDGAYSNRYRVRGGFDRPFTVQGVSVTPYAHAEIAYDTRFDEWNRQRYQAGVEIGLTPFWRIEPYFARENDSVLNPSRINAFGLVLKYFH